MRALRRITCLALVFAASAIAAPPPFANPPELVSVGGLLGGTLTVAPASVTVAKKQVTTTVYNGSYLPPLLRVQPGDHVGLVLVNDGLMPTNIHYHGFQVTPLGRGDNVFLMVEPGAQLQYDFDIPADHPPGLYWYHPHFHPDVNPQIVSGLSGGIIIGDILAPFPELAGIPERVLLLKDMRFKKGEPIQDPDPDGPTKRTVNGLFKPRMTIAPGELQFWRIGNIGANIYYKLRLEHHQFAIIAQDGNLKNQIVTTKELLIPPAARYEVLVRGAKKGTYKLHAKKFKTGPAGDAQPAQVIATLKSTGPKVTNQVPLPSNFPSPPDLRNVAIDAQRPFVFADKSTTPDEQFTINDQYYDHDRIDTRVPLGNVEEWTITNSSRELHVFHIHQTDFQVTEINGEAQPFTGYQDTVSLPYATKKKGQLVPGEVKIRIPFTNPLMVGKFVYHCHIVQHADQGMMANIEVVPPLVSPVATPHHR